MKLRDIILALVIASPILYLVYKCVRRRAEYYWIPFKKFEEAVAG